jgi:hypothetical protein
MCCHRATVEIFTTLQEIKSADRLLRLLEIHGILHYGTMGIILGTEGIIIGMRKNRVTYGIDRLSGTEWRYILFRLNDNESTVSEIDFFQENEKNGRENGTPRVIPLGSILNLRHQD